MKDENSVSAECIDISDVGAVLELPADDPVRRHAESCPRCRSLLASYRAFTGAEPVAGADLEKARAMLDARIRADASHWKPATAPARASWWQWRPLPLVAAALVVIAAGALWMSSRQPEEDSLRESASTSQAFKLQPAQIASDGSIELHWSAMTGADQYQVRIYGPDFGEIYRSTNTPETTLSVARAALPANLPPTLDLTWRVFALSQGDVIATSDPGSIRSR